MSLFRRLHEAVRALWDRARREHSTPREIGWSFGLGAFVACTPLLGLHFWLAIGLATVFRLNRLWCVIGSRLSSSPILLVTTFCEIQVAHRLRTGEWVPLELHEALRRGRELLLDWVVGTFVVGAVIAVAAGLAAYGIAAWRARVRARTHERVPPEISESAP